MISQLSECLHCLRRYFSRSQIDALYARVYPRLGRVPFSLEAHIIFRLIIV